MKMLLLLLLRSGRLVCCTRSANRCQIDLVRSTRFGAPYSRTEDEIHRSINLPHGASNRDNSWWMQEDKPASQSQSQRVQRPTKTIARQRDNNKNENNKNNSNNKNNNEARVRYLRDCYGLYDLHLFVSFAVVVGLPSCRYDTHWWCWVVVYVAPDHEHALA
jgi:hypothetical protein